MKLLYIVRHAKSSWGNADLPDHERPLMPIGIKRTKKVISILKSHNTQPDVILSSSALRARDTAELIAKGLNFPEERIKIDPAIYRSDSNDIFELFNELSNGFEAAMIIGHNPTLTDFANYFLVPPIENLPTSAVVCLQINTDQWSNIRQVPFEVKFIIFPKLI